MMVSDIHMLMEQFCVLASGFSTECVRRIYYREQAIDCSPLIL
jgi:hypothetical protein